jgi:hypothetical protein
MSSLTKAASNYRKAEVGLAKARTELEQAIAAEGFIELHRHISDNRVVDVLYESGNGEARRFHEFAAMGGKG